MNIEDEALPDPDDRVTSQIESSHLVRELWSQINVRPINQVFEHIRDKISNPIRDRVWSQLVKNNEH